MLCEALGAAPPIPPAIGTAVPAACRKKRKNTLCGAAVSLLAICALCQTLAVQQRSTQAVAQRVGLQKVMTRQFVFQSLAQHSTNPTPHVTDLSHDIVHDMRTVQTKAAEFQLKAARIAQVAKQLEAVDNYHHLHEPHATEMQLSDVTSLAAANLPQGSAAGERSAHKLMQEVTEFEDTYNEKTAPTTRMSGTAPTAPATALISVAAPSITARASTALHGDAQVEDLLHTAHRYKSLGESMHTTSEQLSHLTGRYEKVMSQLGAVAPKKAATGKSPSKAKSKKNPPSPAKLMATTKVLRGEIQHDVHKLGELLQQASHLPKSAATPKLATKTNGALTKDKASLHAAPAAVASSRPLTPADGRALRRTAQADRKKAIKLSKEEQKLDAKKPAEPQLKGWRLEYAKLMATPSQENHEMAKEIKSRHAASDLIHARLDKERARMAKLLHGLES